MAKTNVIGERFEFNFIRQSAFQPSKYFVIQLKKQAVKCKLGDSTENMIRDQIVIGISDENARKRLLANAKLTLQKAIDTIQIKNQVGRDSRCFHLIAFRYTTCRKPDKRKFLYAQTRFYIV